MNDFFSESNKRYELFECECKKATKKHHNNSQLQNFASDVKKNKKMARAGKISPQTLKFTQRTQI